MFGAKNISITMETLDVVLCAERMVTSVAFPRLFVRIPFPFVPPSCFFDNAMYNLSAPLTMRAFGILMFRSKKNISITMETLDVVLCAERMVTSVAFQ